MIITFVRSIILYILVLLVMRLMGKREIGQLQPFELAISIMIADLASIPMTDIGIPIFNGIIPILGLLTMHLIISVINLKSMRAREIICGKPSILIYRGKINEKILKKERVLRPMPIEPLKEASLEELARVLLMINKKRGYKSSRKAKGSDLQDEFDRIWNFQKNSILNLFVMQPKKRLKEKIKVRLGLFWQSTLHGPKR